MTLSRRRFVQTATLSLLAGSTLASAMAQAGIEAQPETFSPENLVAFNGISMRAFEALKGEPFQVSSEGRSLGSMTLLSVAEYVPAAPAPATGRLIVRAPKSTSPAVTGFSVQFQGSGAALPQGTYVFQNAAIGSLPLLVVPSGPDASPATYTAVFNFLVEPRSVALPAPRGSSPISAR